ILPCVIVGYRMKRASVHSVLVASLHDRVLRYVGQVSRGFTVPMQAELAARLFSRSRSHPVVPCPKPACWVEPGLCCRVRFQEWTHHGRLRHPVFDGWLELPGCAPGPDRMLKKTSDNRGESA